MREKFLSLLQGIVPVRSEPGIKQRGLAPTESSSARRINPYDPTLPLEAVNSLPPLDQLKNTFAEKMSHEGKDPNKHKQEIDQQAIEARKSWENR